MNRCAAGSRIIVFEQVYDRFKAMLVEAAGTLKVGTADTDDYGPVINEDQMKNMLAAVARAKAAGASVISGGGRLTGAGYDNGYRTGEWFPVEVNIGNDGPDVSAVLEWSFPGQPEEQTFQRTIELPRGARKRVLLDVFAGGFVRNGLVRLLDGSTEPARQDVTLESFDESVFLIGMVSSDPALLNSLDAQQVVGFSNTRVRHIAASGLPESPAQLRGLNALFLHDIDTAALGPAQREAIGLWASQGGQLVISGGVNAQKVASGLADLLPTVKVLFVEYDSRHARRALGRLLDATHELYIGNMFLDQGECTYLRADVAELDAATEHLRRAFAAALAQPTP